MKKLLYWAPIITTGIATTIILVAIFLALGSDESQLARPTDMTGVPQAPSDAFDAPSQRDQSRAKARLRRALEKADYPDLDPGAERPDRVKSVSAAEPPALDDDVGALQAASLECRQFGRINEAMFKSRDFVRQKLSAPRGARFPPFDRRNAERSGPCRFRIADQVDRENESGDMVRTGYVAILDYDPKRADWTLLSIEFTDQ